MDHQSVIDATRRWIAGVVIDLNLCPFARRVFDAGLIRFVVSEATDVETLQADLARELTALADAPRTTVETTVMIHPVVLTDFFDFNDFLGVADELIETLNLRGVLQIASFHPDYRFAGTAPNAVENYTNRSPYPMLHLLREESITEVSADPEALEAIPQRNIRVLRELGRKEILKRLQKAKDG